MIRNAAALLALLCTSSLSTENVDVRGRGPVDLATFACTDTPRSTVVQRVCYDEARQHLLVNADGAYSEFCRLPAATFEAFIVAPSMGQYYRQHIAVAATPFACDGARTN
jgi:hypothetical protein